MTLFGKCRQFQFLEAYCVIDTNMLNFVSDLLYNSSPGYTLSLILQIILSTSFSSLSGKDNSRCRSDKQLNICILYSIFIL